MNNDDIRCVIDLLQRKLDEKRDESTRYALGTRGYEAMGFANGMAYAIGAIATCMSDEK